MDEHLDLNFRMKVRVGAEAAFWDQNAPGRTFDVGVSLSGGPAGVTVNVRGPRQIQFS